MQLIFNGYTVCLSLHLSPETMWFMEGNGSFCEKKKGREDRKGKERIEKEGTGEDRRREESLRAVRHECKGKNL